MTISRKLYTGFGSILGILVLLFVVSFTASHVEHNARNTGGQRAPEHSKHRTGPLPDHAGRP